MSLKIMNNIKMLYFYRMIVSEGTDINKTSSWREYDICHYWYFLNKGFKFQPNVCNWCHNLFMMFMTLSDIAVFNIKGSDYRCFITGISKSDFIKLLQNVALTGKIGAL